MRWVVSEILAVEFHDRVRGWHLRLDDLTSPIVLVVPPVIQNNLALYPADSIRVLV